MSRNGAVVIATCYGLEDRGVGVRALVGSRIFISPNRSDRFCDHPASHPTDTGGTLLFPMGVKRHLREFHHSPRTSAEVKKT
jgi:hypothetical protein